MIRRRCGYCVICDADDDSISQVVVVVVMGADRQTDRQTTED